jgi:AraC family transcriptional regulator
LDGGRAEEAKTRTGIVGHAPDHEAWFRRRGPYANVVVLVPARDLLEFPETVDTGLRRGIAAGFCFRDGYRGGALHDAALALFGGLRGTTGLPAHPLWLQAKSLEFAALFLDGQPGDAAAIPAAERRRLLAARDRLLADLADPPTIAQLARESGLNVLKLKRGFKQLFGLGVYGLFQRERMHEARRRLRQDETSVGRVAAELGYANASHFAAAFRKQFGVAPGEIGRR